MTKTVIATVEEKAQSPESRTTTRGYPRQITIASVADVRIRDSLAASGKDVAVLIAPGIHAERGSAPLGEVADYTSVKALCVDFNQYQAARTPDPISRDGW